MKHIKDPIHGYIDMPDEELSIINNSQFQRLRRIKQLGFSSVVYPSATHTRFSHSLGVMKLGHDLAESAGLSKGEIRLNQVAGLLHDIGHLPFSHTLESLLHKMTGLTHEDLSCKYIDEINEDNSTDFPVDHNKVKDIIRGDYQNINIICNEIDADRIDYLIRDSHHTGIKLGDIEKDTLIKFAETINGKLGFNHKSLGSVEHLLDSRMQMGRSVYSHDTVNITETMLERAVEKYIKNSSNDMMDIVGLYDSQLSSQLLESNVVAASDLFERIQNRNLYKTAYYNTLDNLSRDEIEKLIDKLSNVTEHESNIADMANMRDHEVLISLPRHGEISEFKTPIKTPSGKVKKLENTSPKPESLRKSQLINSNLHIFTKPEHKNKIKKASNDYLSSYEMLDL